MGIRAVTTYPFETDWLIGEIRCHGVPKPGVIYLAHKGEPKPPYTPGYDLLPEVPRQALLMPEWLKKAGRSDGIFWAPCRAQARTMLDRDTVIFTVDAEQTRDWNLSVEFRYTPGPDWIDFEMRLLPNTAHGDFDFFFASYLIEDMESTWVPASIGGREEWRKLDNRRSEPWGNMYHVPRDAAYRKLLYDGRYGDIAGNPGVAEYEYSRPILVCQKQASGLACVTLIEPDKSRTLCGQKHRYETAHDFTFSGDLVPGRPFSGRARLVVRNIGPFPEAAGEIDAMWREFEETLAVGEGSGSGT